MGTGAGTPGRPTGTAACRPGSGPTSSVRAFAGRRWGAGRRRGGTAGAEGRGRVRGVAGPSGGPPTARRDVSGPCRGPAQSEASASARPPTRPRTRARPRAAGTLAGDPHAAAGPPHTETPVETPLTHANPGPSRGIHTRTHLRTHTHRCMWDTHVRSIHVRRRCEHTLTRDPHIHGYRDS